MSDRRRLGVQDALWLEMDRPNNLMVVDSVIWTAEPLDWDRVRTVMEERLCERYPVFRSRAVRDDDGAWWWEEDEAFSFDERVTIVDLDDSDDVRSLQRLVAQQRTVMLDRERPLWLALFVDRYRDGECHRVAHAPCRRRRHAHGAAVDEPVRRRTRGWRHPRSRGHSARAPTPRSPGRR